MKNKLWLAFILALLFHITLLNLKVTPARLSSQTKLSINVKLNSLSDTLKEERKERVEDQIESLIDPLEAAVPKPENQERSVVKTNSVVIAKPTAQVSSTPKLKLSVNSGEFKRFLQQETATHQSNNPDEVQGFGNTFEESVATESVVTLGTVKAQTQLLSTGVFATQDKNGNRTCYAKIENMLDISASASFTSQDCTPKKNFDLKMDTPNNG